MVDYDKIPTQEEAEKFFKAFNMCPHTYGVASGEDGKMISYVCYHMTMRKEGMVGFIDKREACPFYERIIKD